MSATEAYRASRDQLLSLRGDHARGGGRVPVARRRASGSTGRSTGSTPIARGNDRAGAGDRRGGRRPRPQLTFDEMATRSDQVAAWLAGAGRRQGRPRSCSCSATRSSCGSRCSAVMKLGAVIMPTTTALGPADLATASTAAARRYVIANAADAAKFDEVPGDYVRDRASGDGPDGWARPTRDAYAARRPSRSSTRARRPTDPLLLYFTSGTTSKPKLVEHTQVSYPVGHLSTMYWIGLRPGRRAPQHQLARAGPSTRGRASSRRGSPRRRSSSTTTRGSTRRPCWSRSARAEVTTFCAPPTVWRMLINADLSGGPGRAARGHRRRRAAQPRGHRAGPAGVGPDHPRRLRPDRDHRCRSATRRDRRSSPGSMGRPAARRARSSSSTRSPASRRRRRGRDLPRPRPQRPVRLMTGYQGDDERNAEAMAGGFYHTGDVADRGRATATSPTSAAPTTCSRPATTRSARSSWRACSSSTPRSPRRRSCPAPDAAAAGGAQGLHRAGARARARRGDGAVDPRATPASTSRPYQRVRRIEFFELPKTISGKIRRVELRARENELAASQGTTAEWRDDQFPELKG